MKKLACTALFALGLVAGMWTGQAFPDQVRRGFAAVRRGFAAVLEWTDEVSYECRSAKS